MALAVSERPTRAKEPVPAAGKTSDPLASLATLDKPCEGTLLHHAGQLYDAALAEEFAKVGIRDLTVRQYQVLRAVEAHPSGSQTDLVEATHIDRSTMADLVRRLSRKGLLARKRTKEDARAYAVKLTDKGVALLEKATPIVKAFDTKGLGAEIMRFVRRS